MKAIKPLVSVGLAVYNGEAYLSQSLDSLLAQDYENIELIISDNASTDRTGEICHSYASGDDRIRYYRNDQNRGPVWNFNRVFELAWGEYFMWACHDDYWDPQYLRSCIEALENHDTAVLAATMCKSVDSTTGELILIDKGLSTISLSFSERFKSYKSAIHGGSCIGGLFYGVYKRDVLSRCMPLKNRITIDHLLLAEICFLGDFITVQRPLMTKRWGGASASIKSIAKLLGRNNRFAIMFPYLERELFLQRIILQTNRLTLAEKLRLSVWSLRNYVRLEVRLKNELLSLWLNLLVGKLPLCIRRSLWVINHPVASYRVLRIKKR